MSSARALIALPLTLALSVAGCALDGATPVEDDEPLGEVSSELAASDSVERAVSQACSTTAVKGLSQQLVDEIQCLRPGTLSRIDGISGLSLGSAVFPYLQTPAANALKNARAARGTTMSINSALRTLPQQYLLYRWYRTGRCGIGLAASPGRSNHESALALDIGDNSGWRSSMTSKGFRWLGANDPVHFDYVGSGAVDLRGLSVKAFQRLWNRNHPTDRIAEDGDYGPQTEQRLSRAPVGGFALGASCAGNPTMTNEPEPAGAPFVVPAEPDAPEPEAQAPSAPPASDPGSVAAPPAVAAEAGCSASPSSAGGGFAPALAVLGLAFAARRRRRSVRS